MLSDAYKSEYERLKEEQCRRIGFRDNLIYANLGVVGAIFALSLSQSNRHLMLLLVPLASGVLGWTYLVNDQAISAIGDYIAGSLSTRLLADLGRSDAGPIFGWEGHHRTNPYRRRRKTIQLVVDLLSFCGPGLIAISTCWWLGASPIAWAVVFGCVEALLLAGLAWEMITSARRAPVGARKGAAT